MIIQEGTVFLKNQFDEREDVWTCKYCSSNQFFISGTSKYVDITCASCAHTVRQLLPATLDPPTDPNEWKGCHC